MTAHVPARVSRVCLKPGARILAQTTTLAPSGRDIDPVVPSCAHCGGWTHRAGTVLRQCDAGHLTRITMTKRYRNEAGRGPCIYFDWSTSKAYRGDLLTQPRAIEVNAATSTPGSSAQDGAA